jgi:1,4-dihydroxy-2-naphthoate octaprenyltransferase
MGRSCTHACLMVAVLAGCVLLLLLLLLQGTSISLLCWPIAWRNAREFWKTESLDDRIIQTDMELPMYLFMG